MKVTCDRNKTEVICFNTKENNKELIPLSFTLGDKEIQRVAATKVLGLTIDEDLSYQQHSEVVLKSLHGIWANLCKYSNRHWGFKQDVMLYLVKTLFLSKLAYASHIWATKNNLKEINSLWYHILKSITGAVLNLGQNIAEVILGVPPLQIQTKVNSIKHFLKLNIKPAARDRYREFLITTYNDLTKSPKSIYIKLKDTFSFLGWKLTLYPTHFSTDDTNIVRNKLQNQYFRLSEKACTYSKTMINRYTETVLWKSALTNQFQVDGYPCSPNPSCDIIPIPKNTSRKTEVLMMSMLYKNNILQSSLYKIGKVASPLCTLCGLEEETADHLLFRCTSVSEDLKCRALQSFNDAISGAGEAATDIYIGFLNASRDPVFISSCIDILKDLNLEVTVVL